MPEMEKVVKGLEICSEYGSWHGLDCEHNEAFKGCPYRGCETGCVVTIAKDAIALLKEHEPVKPRRDANCVRMFRCGACGEYVGFIDSDPGDPNEQDNYCRNCGRPVKWE